MRLCDNILLLFYSSLPSICKTNRLLFATLCGIVFGIAAVICFATFLTASNYDFICSPLPSTRESSQLVAPKSVLVLIGATGNYFNLAVDLIDSAKRHFCKPARLCSNVTYLVFSDTELATYDGNNSLSIDNHYVEIIRQPRLGWPDDSMKRYHTYLKQLPKLQTADFILALDADLRFLTNVSLAEIYGDLVATLHPGYMTSERWNLPFERKNSRSKAYVPRLAACRYFTAAIWGGSSANFIRALRTLVWQLDSDVKNLGANFTAVWHDESHLNRYFVDNPPSRILTPSYYYPEDDQYYGKEVTHLPKKIFALAKDHTKLRFGLPEHSHPTSS